MVSLASSMTIVKSGSGTTVQLHRSRKELSDRLDVLTSQSLCSDAQLTYINGLGCTAGATPRAMQISLLGSIRNSAAVQGIRRAVDQLPVAENMKP